MAISELVNQCKGWDLDRWTEFDNTYYQEKVFSRLSKTDQKIILREKELFFNCYCSSTPNAISEGDKYAPPETGYEHFLEETMKKQEEYIKNRGASFVFYQSFIEALEDMDDKQFRESILALCNYGLFKQKSDYKGMVKMYMTQAIPQLDSNERRRLTNIINGHKSPGAPKGNQNARKD
jgi:hypothetical protein